MGTTVDSLYRLLVQSVTDYAIYMLSVDGYISNWNAGAERVKGYTASEIVGSHFSRFYQEEDRRNRVPQLALQTVLEAGRFEGEGWRVRKDGSMFWAHVVIDPVRDDEGSIIGFAKITRDLSERLATQRTASKREQIFRLLVQGAKDYAIYSLDPTGRVSTWNAGAQRAKLYEASEIIGEHFSRFYTPEDREKGGPERALATALKTGKFEDYGWRVRKDGSRFWAHVVLEPIYDEIHSLVGFAKITQDLTDSKRQMDELTTLKGRLDLALSNMSQALCLYDAEERLILKNHRFEEMMGDAGSRCPTGSRFYDLLELLEAGQEERHTKSAPEAFLRRHRSMIGSDQRGYHHEQDWFGKRLVVSHRGLAAGGWVTTIDDVTERKQIEERIVHLAHHDPLTGLANRSHFSELVEGLFKQQQPCVLLYLDLDRFKPVNDSLGHPVGDELLRQVARRVLNALPAKAVAARLGGDEFAIVQSDFIAPEEASTLAQALLREISRPFEVKGFEVSIGLSIGIAQSLKDGSNADLLFRNADLALYAAKAAGRNCFKVYEPAMEAAIAERHSLEIDLRQALKQQQFFLVYQPVVDDEAHAITSVEALLRWQHPSRGTLHPPEFLTIAEELGIMPEIGDWVLRTACNEAVAWPSEINLAVNLSIAQFRVPDLAERVLRILAGSGLPPGRLELEITETAIIHDLQSTSDVLHTLRRAGLSIALDDFGTGYSSLSFLRTLPFTRIKIDRSFTQDIGREPGANAIIRAIAGLCLSLGVAVTAEGVESEEQRLLLRTEGCRVLQGYLFSVPLKARDLDEWIAAYTGVQFATIPKRLLESPVDSFPSIMDR